MAKTRTNAEPICEVVIKYDLFDLPTAQHKAGLAGLLLQIGSMRDRKVAADCIPEILEQTPTTAIVRFTEKSVQGIFNDLYDASVEKVEVKSKWQGQEPIDTIEVEEIDPETKKPKKGKRFVYEVVQPRGHFLKQHLPEMDPKKDWHKLWRDMLWAIPRGNPNARIPFQQRSRNEPCKDGRTMWSELVKVEEKRQKNQFHMSEVAGSLWLGAQAVNAEAIPFEGRAEQNLLLYFWPLTTLIFVPQQIDSEGESEFVGYVLAIPEVADLENFQADYLELLHNLGGDIRGFRPAEAIIDLPAQGALAFLEHLARLAEQTVSKGQLHYSVSSIEFLHLVKIGNNIKSMAAGRVAPDSDLLRKYREIVGVKGKPPPYRNPLFRRGLLLALLNDQTWHEPMASLLAERPWPFFIRSERSPTHMPWFWQDAATQFAQLFQRHHESLKEYDEMTSDSKALQPETPLPLLIHRLVQAYINRRTEEKSGKKWEDFKDKKIKDEKTGKERIDIPADYREAREKLASGIFLEMRSRREQEFVDHFTGTFCSVKQYLPEEDFRIVAEALLTQPEKVKTLTLLALSANS